MKLLLVVVMGVACASTASTAPRAVVDMKRAAMECRDGRLAREELGRTHRQSQEVLDRRGAELRAKLASLREDRARGQDVREREAALQREIADVHAEYVKLQQELSALEERKAAPIYARLREALPRLAAAHKVPTIAERSPVYAGGGEIIDLTEELIRAVDGEGPVSTGGQK